MKHPLRRTKTYGLYRYDCNNSEKIPVWFNYNGNKMWITYTVNSNIRTETVKMGKLGYRSENFILPEIEDILFNYWNWRDNKK